LISPSSAGSGSSGYSSVFTAVSQLKGSRDTTVYAQALLEAFLNIFLRSATLTDEGFSDKKENFWSWHYFHYEPDYWYFLTMRHQIKRILLYIRSKTVSECGPYIKKLFLCQM
jgi:hypothetical protein